MKKLLAIIFRPLLKDFRCYRKRIGGTWYRIRNGSGQAGFAGPMEYWQQEQPADDRDLSVIQTENYISKQSSQPGNM